MQGQRQLDPGAYDSLPLALHPAVRPVSSDYPIVKIWLANQPGAADEVIHLDAGGDRVLVCESHDGLEFHRLSDAEFALAEAAGAGATLGEAAGRALAAADESFDLVRSLQHLLGAGALVFPTLGVRSHENH
jgi:hypothetical protein